MAQQTITSGAGVLWETIKGFLNNNFTELYTAVAEKAPALGADDNYVTDAEKAAIGTISGKENIQPSTLALTEDTAISEAQILANKYISNYGAAVEIDITLPAVSYNISRTIIVEAAQIIEVAPPSGELFDLSGTLLDADDVVDSPAIVGSKMVATRMRTGASTWRWSLDVSRGNWVDSGASD